MMTGKLSGPPGRTALLVLAVCASLTARADRVVEPADSQPLAAVEIHYAGTVQIHSRDDAH